MSVAQTLLVLRRSSKIPLQMIKLYERTIPEDSQGDHITADLVHHFLLAICTCPGTGICFRDRGWYPRETEEERGGFHQPDNEEEEGDGRQNKKGRIHNKILANIVKTLKVNEDLRQQELALKILTACPELVSGYAVYLSSTSSHSSNDKWTATGLVRPSPSSPDSLQSGSPTSPFSAPSSPSLCRKHVSSSLPLIPLPTEPSSTTLPRLPSPPSWKTSSRPSTQSRTSQEACSPLRP